jgi:peptide chain release factor 3
MKSRSGLVSKKLLDASLPVARLGNQVRLGRAYRLFARERQPIEEAFPGDVIGVINPGQFAIGDTISAGLLLRFTAIPRFSPEHFGALVNTDIARYKQFQKGLAQLEEEGAVQVFYAIDASRQEPILGVVGELQFDVVAARLREEYGVETRLERRSLTRARWLPGGNGALTGAQVMRGCLTCRDREGRPVILFPSDWEVDYFQRQNPDIELSDIA